PRGIGPGGAREHHLRRDGARPIPARGEALRGAPGRRAGRSRRAGRRARVHRAADPAARRGARLPHARHRPAARARGRGLLAAVRGLTALALDLDHVGVAVRDLDAGREAYRRLGFNLTPRSEHKGSRVPGGPIEPWGSANHCAMLEQGYLEVLGLTDPEKFSSAKAMIERYEGVHIVAFRPESVDAAHTALSSANLPVDSPRDLERMASYGPDGAESRRVAFRNMYLTKSVFTEAQFQYTEHLTREAMWQPRLLRHPNGALG